MSASDWLEILLLAGLWGAAGQTARVAVGLKKLNDEAAAKQQPMEELLHAPRLLVSILLGFVAGMFAALGLVKAGAILDHQAMLGFAAAGYAGTDFIEGVMSRYLPGAQVSKPDDDHVG